MRDQSTTSTGVNRWTGGSTTTEIEAFILTFSMTSETVRVLDEADLGNDCPISTNEEVIGLLLLQAQA
jgi:hypothetical protein